MPHGKRYKLTNEEMKEGVFQHKEVNVALTTIGIIGKSKDGIRPEVIYWRWITFYRRL